MPEAFEPSADQERESSRVPAARSAMLRLPGDQAPSTGFGSEAQAGSRNTASQGRAAISSFIAAGTWVSTRSHPNTTGARS